MKFLLLLISFHLFQPKNEIIELAKQVEKKYNVKNKRYVVIIDFKKSIYEKRLYVVDIENSQIVMESVVSHALNTGKEYASSFSNEPNSKKSSLGAFETSSTYYGYYGYSLKIKGLDKKLNDNCEKRAIIIHSTKKMSTPWSWGCFSVPDENNKKLIELVKNGCLIFAHN
jgi:hypothetical protein